VQIINKGFKYRLYPTKEQQAALEVQFGCARFVWNMVLALRQQYYADNGKGFGYKASAGLLTWLKQQPDTAFLNDANAQVLQQKLMDQQAAFEDFFDNVKRGIHPAGYPQFKRKGATSQSAIRSHPTS